MMESCKSCIEFDPRASLVDVGWGRIGRSPIMEILEFFAGPIVIIDSRGGQGEIRIHVGNQQLPSMDWDDAKEERVKQSCELMDLSAGEEGELHPS